MLCLGIAFFLNFWKILRKILRFEEYQALLITSPKANLDRIETKETTKTNCHATQIKLLPVLKSDITSSTVKSCAIILEQNCFFCIGIMYINKINGLIAVCKYTLNLS